MVNNIEDELKIDANIKICKTHSKTDGQERACMRKILLKQMKCLLFFCDNGVLYNFEKLSYLMTLKSM